jgi:hypothetical protein
MSITRVPRTIDDALVEMDAIVLRCKQQKSRLGYFAVLYRDVTRGVKKAITAGRFQDGDRMERLDAIFAARYLEAVQQLWAGSAPTRSWRIAFEATNQRSPIILQHLLLGMNAHINLDLSIAAAKTSPGAELASLRADFQEITRLLDEMINDVQRRITQVSPWMGLLDRIGGRTDERVCSFCIGEARNVAWASAQKLSAAGPGDFEREIDQQDCIVAELGKLVRNPGPWVRTGLWLISARETTDVPAVMEALAER